MRWKVQGSRLYFYFRRSTHGRGFPRSTPLNSGPLGWEAPRNEWPLLPTSPREQIPGTRVEDERHRTQQTALPDSYTKSAPGPRAFATRGPEVGVAGVPRRVVGGQISHAKSARGVGGQTAAPGWVGGRTPSHVVVGQVVCAKEAAGRVSGVAPPQPDTSLVWCPCRDRQALARRRPTTESGLSTLNLLWLAT